MGKKERQEKKEKPLDKMTAKELRELAMTIPDITGAHGMNKEELISSIKEARGIVDEKKKTTSNVRDDKKKIAEMKAEKAQAKDAGDKKRAEILRKKISRLKKKTRRAA